MIANLLTFLSLAFGFSSVILSLENQFTPASWAIIFSAIFDGLDGKLARKSSRTSEFGRELDSLVDVISFGVAPAMLVYIFMYRYLDFVAVTTLLIYLLCAVTRLAMYNITPKERMVNYFYGLPTTAAGALLGSFVLVYRQYDSAPPICVFLSLTLLISFLMVSRIKYLNLDGLRQILGKGLFLVSLILLVCFCLAPQVTAFALFLIYLIFSPFMVKSLRSRQ